MKKNYSIYFILALLFIFKLPTNSGIAQVSFSGPELLGCPTKNSITINVVPDENIDSLYYQYGTSSGNYTARTVSTSANADEPHEVVISGLEPNTRYYYRMRYSTDGGSNWIERAEYSFYTQRAPGSTFTFTIIADTHAEYADAEYQAAIQNVISDQPDIHLDLGDTFMTDNDGSQSQVNDAYLVSRNSLYMGGIGNSTPIFLASGNHENEEGWNLDDAPFSPALASIQARKLYYPTPITDGFYSGNNDILTDIDAATYGDQYREDYYAWEWGDALFVVFDPFQYTMYNPYGNMAGEGNVGENDPATGDRWNWTLGQEQYNWLKQTLENSNAKYKFMFAHHMLGGTQNYVREGATPAHMFEWGGYNADGTTWGWDTERSGWEENPIHQLMIDNGVSAFFHGHDHQYAYEVRDGIVYQCLPKPSPGLDFNYYSESDPYTERVIGNSGHLRVTVTPDLATVEYVRSNTTGVSHSYTIAPNSSSTDPTITITGTPLSTFSSEPGTPSAEQSYMVSGSNLTDNITISAPTNFEISVTSGSGWTSSLTLTESGGDVAETNIYVRFYPITEGTYSGDITHTSSGATTQNVAVSGTTAPHAIIYFGDIGTATIKDNTNNDLVVTTTAAVDAGDDIIIVYASDPVYNLIVSVTDGVGNIYEEVAVAINQAQVRTHIFAAYNVTALPSGSTITLTQSAGTAPTARAAVVSVFHGLADSGVLDRTSTNDGDNSSTPSSGATGMTNQADELLIGAVGTEGPEGDDAGTWQNSFIAGPRDGTTGGDAAGNITASMGYRIVSATGTYSAEKTGITARDWAAAIATFQGGPMRYSAITSDYNGADGFSASISHSNGDYITATATNGTINSIHVYRIDEDANIGTTIEPSSYFVDPLRYWGVRIFGTENPEYQVVYMYDGHPGINDETSLRIARRTGPTDDTWIIATDEAPDPINNNITLTQQTGTEYSLASEVGDNPLPVNLTSFSAELVEGGVELKWITKSQLNNAGFEIWRATDGTDNFCIITSYTNNPNLAGEGNTSTHCEYSFLDQTVETGKTYLYKLSDVDNNGKRTFHNVIEINVVIVYPKEYTLYPNYPNPFNPETTIRFYIPESKVGSKMSIQIYNIYGQLIRTLFNDKIAGGEHEIIWDSRNDNGTKLPSGIYCLELNTTNFRQVQKMIMLK